MPKDVDVGYSSFELQYSTRGRMPGRLARPSSCHGLIAALHRDRHQRPAESALAIEPGSSQVSPSIPNSFAEIHVLRRPHRPGNGDGSQNFEDHPIPRSPVMSRYHVASSQAFGTPGLSLDATDMQTMLRPVQDESPVDLRC
ncbi:hypothetical protein CC2G_011397 [Coprinopsis cinerea AmutBmut pab1-1]|nr:hypothetical protein CC2G_011397 [Coprinopsis cinerea AmutBmut pab1-1]